MICNPWNKNTTWEKVFGKEKTFLMKKNLKLKNLGKKHSNKTKEQMSKSHIGFKHKKESLLKMSKNSGVKYNKKYIIKTFKIMPNVKKIDYNKIRKAYNMPSINSLYNIFGTLDKLEQLSKKEFIRHNFGGGKGQNEDKILDELEKKYRIKLIRHYQCRCDSNYYFIDGYDPINNIAYEVDEYYHKGQKVQDKIREKKIIQKLSCKFVRIKDY